MRLNRPLVSTQQLERPWARIAVATLLTLSAYFVVGALAFGVYSAVAGAIYDRSTQEGLTALKTLFYVCFGAHLLITAMSAGLLIRWHSASVRFAVPIILGILIPLVFLQVGLASLVNSCEMDVSFPLEGASC